MVVILQTTPLIAGLAIGAAAYAGRALLQVGSKWSTAGSAVGRSFYKVSLPLLSQTGGNHGSTRSFSAPVVGNFPQHRFEKASSLCVLK